MFRFEDLEVWKRAVEAIDPIFDLADQIDARRKHRFAEQLQSAALSITNNIAEGSGSTSKQEFRQFLNFSHRSVSETANMIIICHRRKYIDENGKKCHLARLEEVSRMIMGFSKSL